MGIPIANSNPMNTLQAVIHENDLMLTYWHTPSEERTAKVESIEDAYFTLAMCESMYGHAQELCVIN